MIFVKNLKQKKIFLGIDLGTTYSLAAIVQKKNIVLLPDEKKRFLLPSVVHYGKNTTVVGWEAQKRFVMDPLNTISSVKRLLGRSIKFVKDRFPLLPYVITDDKNGGILLHTTSRIVTPIDVSSEILTCLKKRAFSFFNQEIDASIITVPAYFNNIQKEATKKAAMLSEMNLIRMLNEPTAAAIAYGLEKHKNGIVVVYDLGGGTFDISVLKLSKGVFEVLATGGDSNLGGDDFDSALASFIYKKLHLSNKIDNIFYSLLLKIAKETKFKLTQYKNVKVHFLDMECYITRDEFNSVIKDLIKKTLLICSNVLEEAELSKKYIEEVVMVGGSTRVPLVYNKVKSFFKKTPLNSINPDQVVAIGAAIQINNMFSNTNIDQKTLLLDVLSISLGIEVMGGFVEKIIFKNSSIPISKTKEFTTHYDNQRSILIHVLQGESEFVKDCVSLSRFVLKNIKPDKAGVPRILVNFQIDANGLIKIIVLEKNNNNKIIKINNSIKLEKNQYQ